MYSALRGCSGQERLFAQQIKVFSGSQIIYRRTFSGNSFTLSSLCIYIEKCVFLKLYDCPELLFITDLIKITTTAIFAAA